MTLGHILAFAPLDLGNFLKLLHLSSFIYEMKTFTVPLSQRYWENELCDRDIDRQIGR